MRPHLDVTVSTDVRHAVTDRLLAAPAGAERHVDAAIAEVFLRDAGALVDGDWDSADLHVGGHPGIEVTDLDTDQALEPAQIGLTTDPRHVADDLTSGHFLDRCVALAVRNLRAAVTGTGVIDAADLADVGLGGIDLFNLSDADLAGLIEMHAATRAADAPGTSVGLRAEYEGYGQPRFWLVVASDDDPGHPSRFRCDGFLAPQAQVTAAIARHGASRPVPA